MPTSEMAPSAPAIPPAPTAEDITKNKLWHNVAVRLADEGVPVRAISRALMFRVEELRDVLEGAKERGTILSIPREDWPPGTRRDERVPDTVPLEFEDEHMTMLAMRTFGVTGSMARIFIALLRRPEMTKAALHLSTGRYVGEDISTDLKIVDVFICKLRKKLPLPIEIKTQWGRGYFIPHEGKVEAFKLLGVRPENMTLRNPQHRPSAGAVGSALPEAA